MCICVVYVIWMICVWCVYAGMYVGGVVCGCWYVCGVCMLVCVCVVRGVRVWCGVYSGVKCVVWHLECVHVPMAKPGWGVGTDQA